MLQKVDAFCVYYQHLDSLYTLFKYRFSGNIVFKNGQIIDNGQRADQFNHQHRRVGSMPSIPKKRLLRKNFKKRLLSSFRMIKSTQTSGSLFGERIEQVKKTKFEIGLIKIVDCLPDGHGNYTSNLVTYKIISH